MVSRFINETSKDLVTDAGTFRVRLIGIDTPELGDCYYQEAKNRLASLIAGHAVALVKDVSEVDRYGRLLRWLRFWCSG